MVVKQVQHGSSGGHKDGLAARAALVHALRWKGEAIGILTAV